MAVRKIQLDRGDTAYVALPEHSHLPGCVSTTVSVDKLLPDYAGPLVHLDFNADNELIGIEILAPTD